MKTIIRPALMLAALLPFAACGDDNSTGPGRYSGTLDFQYSGAYSGSFHAESDVLPRDFDTGSAVFGQRTQDVAGDEAYIFAQQDGPGSMVDNLIFSVADPAVGTVSCAIIDENCPLSAILVLGDDGAREDDDADAILLSSAGSVTITSITDKRIQGNFQFTMSDLFEDEQTVTRITSGSFDVPLLSSTDGLGGSLSRMSPARLSRSR
ncbi:hypothetical protein [Longimicrobium terrae]|uniref:Uncharacterized protein n=1 Tax=Longimicrobium terrae TaxID=1639882 RepID=A0A841GYF3_9BACT|nr:hypothetical protein [Longimicrobium terrae]MBB4636686.1 hypothetical protein [Longimicrobium terrae]MBB6070790.1 hypothetical protein [Longimicrobium terrae]NNC28816.1 hypothetical protein [Longimicrobium terrae]